MDAVQLAPKTSATVREAIRAIMAKRRQQVPEVERRLQAWSNLELRLDELSRTLDRLLLNPHLDHDSSLHIRQFKHELGSRTQVSKAELRTLLGRVSRSTVNIGVSGQARMGKSTLLQQLSGLGEDQIPTGAGLPVTAVRSRLYHSQSSFAEIEYHSFDSFRQEVLGPCHSRLGLGEPPSSLEQFRKFDYTRLPTVAPDGRRDFQHIDDTRLNHLRQFQAALPSYEALLTGKVDRLFDLSQLRKLVRYPSAADLESGSCERQYLAVRDVKIYSRFPYEEVEDLVLIDLPGLSDITVEPERHVDGLKHDVDVVLLVKRAIIGFSHWTPEDAQAVGILDRARGPIRNRSDFILIAANNGGCDEDNVSAMATAIRIDANQGEEGKHFRVLDCDAMSSQSVENGLLRPLLSHLADRLGVMDQDVLAFVDEVCRANANAIRLALEGLAPTFNPRDVDAGQQGQFRQKFKKLHDELLLGIQSIEADAKTRADQGKDDLEFVEKAKAAREELRSWARDGFGRGLDAWKAQSLPRLVQDRAAAPFANSELHKIRIQITDQFCQIDEYLIGREQAVKAELAAVLRQQFKDLVKGDGQAALIELAEKVKVAGASSLPAALLALARFEVRYRALIHPRIRPCLDVLNTNEIRFPPIDKLIGNNAVDKAAEELRRKLVDLANRATDQVFQQLTKVERNLPARAVRVAVEHFSDSMFRTQESDDELQNVAWYYKDLVWGSGSEAERELNEMGITAHRQIASALNSSEEVFGGQ